MPQASGVVFPSLKSSAERRRAAPRGLVRCGFSVCSATAQLTVVASELFGNLPGLLLPQAFI